MYGDTSSEGLVIENADIDVARMVRASGNSMSGFMMIIMMRCELLESFERKVGRQLYSRRLNDKKTVTDSTQL